MDFKVNVSDTLIVERLFLSAFAVMARIATVFAAKGMMPRATNTCRRFRAELCMVLLGWRG